MADPRAQGFEALMQKLEHLPARVVDRALIGTVQAGLAPVLEAARSNIHSETGTLARSLRLRVRRTRTGDQLEGVVWTTPKGFYGRFVEFGTKHAPAHPFVAPAIAAGADAAVQAIGEILRTHVREEIAAP